MLSNKVIPELQLEKVLQKFDIIISIISALNTSYMHHIDLKGNLFLYKGKVVREDNFVNNKIDDVNELFNQYPQLLEALKNDNLIDELNINIALLTNRDSLNQDLLGNLISYSDSILNFKHNIKRLNLDKIKAIYNKIYNSCLRYDAIIESNVVNVKLEPLKQMRKELFDPAMDFMHEYIRLEYDEANDMLKKVNHLQCLRNFQYDKLVALICAHVSCLIIELNNSIKPSKNNDRCKISETKKVEFYNELSQYYRHSIYQTTLSTQPLVIEKLNEYTHTFKNAPVEFARTSDFIFFSNINSLCIDINSEILDMSKSMFAKNRYNSPRLNR